MALYDGFFDAELASDGSYDRSYESGDFTGYFANIIGSGVCVHNNPDSFKAEYENGTLYLRPGYLFIRGYWLANQAGEGESNYKGYAVTMPADMAGPMAVVAHLNLGQRMIEINVQAVSQAYPDALVLAIVTDSAAEDTRYNTDLCGVIDTAGELSAKVEWALHYIDNEIEGRLDKAEADIAAKSAEMDAKIAEVSALVAKLAPPPVGTIKFTASQNVDADWLPCDGSFINEADYPDLVAALGKHSPGVEDFEEKLEASKAGYISNCCLVGQTAWFFLLDEMKLVGLSNTGRKEITITGVNSLRKLANLDTVLSICGGALYISQWGNTAAEPVLFECAGFTGEEENIAMSALNISSKLARYFLLPYIVPRVVSVQGKSYMALGGKFYDRVSHSNQQIKLEYISWVPGDFSNATIHSSIWEGSANSPNVDKPSDNILKCFLSFSPKNSNELLYATGRIDQYVNQEFGLYFSICSILQNIFGDPDVSDIQMRHDDAIKYGTEDYNRYIGGNVPLSIIPVGGDNECLFRAEIAGGKLAVDVCTYNPIAWLEHKTVPVKLPSRAKVFKESVCYISQQSLWIVFLGTGILFTKSVINGPWGYLDTTPVLGYISVFGCADYDSYTNTLWLSGVDSTGIPRVGKLKFPDLFDYANDGAWLPQIASDGVPAYIKAKSDGESSGIPDSVNITITVSSPSGSFDTYADIIFNGTPLLAGTYKRVVSASGTFTVGMRGKEPSGALYCTVKMNGNTIVSGSIPSNNTTSYEKTATFNVSDYVENGITLKGSTT